MCAVTVNADAAYIRVWLTNAVPVNADAAYFHVLLTRAVTANADAAYFCVLLTRGVTVNADAAYFCVLLTHAVTVNADAVYFCVLNVGSRTFFTLGGKKQNIKVMSVHKEGASEIEILSVYEIKAWHTLLCAANNVHLALEPEIVFLKF